MVAKASLELEQERTRSLQQEMAALKHDLDAARATEAVAERQRQEHAKMAADSFGEYPGVHDALFSQQRKLMLGVRDSGRQIKLW